MPIDLTALGGKLRKYREQFQMSVAEVAQATGLEQTVLEAFEAGTREPTGDEILILADYYKCDFKFFISNERVAPFEQTESLFRRLGDRLSRDDRWAIQEFLFLCECEEQLLSAHPVVQREPFLFSPKGTFFKAHGRDAAAALRQHLGYDSSQVPHDIYRDMRRLGLHVYRRRLENSDISGLFVKHPVVGKCVLVNYSEDLYRQRFSAAHELGHAILDGEQEFVVDDKGGPVTTIGKWDRADLVEIRANVFASSFLLPPDLLARIPDAGKWTEQKTIDWANRLEVNAATLAYALSAAELIDKDTENLVRGSRVPRSAKQDPEIPGGLSDRGKTRKRELLERGLSDFHVKLCFDAYETGHISAARMAEMLLVREPELDGLAALHGRAIVHGD